MTRDDTQRSGPPAACRYTHQDESIGLIMAHRQNRALLSDWLTPGHDVRTLNCESLDDLESEPIDLVLVDGGAFERCAERIEAYREAGSGLFRPVLLLTEAPPRHPRIWRVADDVIEVPVEKAILDARIGGLLDRRRLSRELAAREMEFRTLFETAPDPVMVVDSAWNVQRVNSEFAGLVGRSADACLDVPLDAFDAFDERAVEAMRMASTNALDGERTTVTVRTPGDEIRYAECSTNRLEPSDGGGSVAFIVILRDITARVHQAAELSRQVDRLEEFGRVLAHELRNPLNIASGWLEQARGTGDSAAFDRVEHAHERMRDMIEDLLVLARQGNVIGEQRSVSLDRLVADSWESVETGSAVFEVDDALQGIVVSCDVERFEEVFANLYRNAVEHGGPEVTVTVGVCTDDHGDTTGVYVADSGPGLAESAREHLFEPGFTTRKTGSGLGLAIVKQIVEAHGWRVRATDSDTGGLRIEMTGIEFSGTAPNQ